MVLESKQTTVAYRCPHCGAGVLSAVGMFSLAADMVKLKCSCGKSELEMVFLRNLRNLGLHVHVQSNLPAKSDDNGKNQDQIQPN